jgi:hypothetical protein
MFDSTSTVYSRARARARARTHLTVGGSSALAHSNASGLMSETATSSALGSKYAIYAAQRGLGLILSSSRIQPAVPHGVRGAGSTWTHISSVTFAHEAHAEDGHLDAALGLSLGGHPGYEGTVRVLREVSGCVGRSRKQALGLCWGWTSDF